MNIHYGATGIPTKFRMDILQNRTTNSSSVDKAEPMVVINNAAVLSNLKSAEDDDFEGCLIKMEPYELQEQVLQSKCYKIMRNLCWKL